MIIKAKVPACDVDQIRFDPEVEGAWVISETSCGHYGPTLFIGPNALETMGVETITRKEAIQRIHRRGGQPRF